MNYDMAIAPGIEIPRASFNRSHTMKTTMDMDTIYPVYWDEVYPNDTFSMNANAFGRIATLLYPLMDDIYIDMHFFFVPMRIIWDNARKFWGEQTNPGDSIAYTIPSMNATTTTGYSELSIFDYFDLPTKVPDYAHISLPLRAYNFIWNEWYRDQNLQNSVTVRTTDGSDVPGDFALLKRGKRHDYFTGGLVELQEGGTTQSLPLGTEAPIKIDDVFGTSGNDGEHFVIGDNAGSITIGGHANVDTDDTSWNANARANLYADLTNATASTILQLRQAASIQKVLELDARAGTRFPEMIYATYGVIFDDVSYRPEFLGGSSSRANVHSVAQTSNDGTNGDVGDLAGFGTVTLENAGFTKSFTEPGYVIGLLSARAPLTYQQGLRREWNRSTRYDFLHPLFQNIGDQSTLVKEIYCQDPATDTGSTGTADNERVFNYQERYAELKYAQNKLTGLFRSNCTSSLEAWHLSEEYGSLPSFDSTFIQSNTPMDRAIAVSTEPHLIVDIYYNLQCARPMHMYSIPGMGTSL
jgi:hypothetical protein